VEIRVLHLNSNRIDARLSRRDAPRLDLKQIDLPAIGVENHDRCVSDAYRGRRFGLENDLSCRVDLRYRLDSHEARGLEPWLD
jgi:hypothetical protein